MPSTRSGRGRPQDRWRRRLLDAIEQAAVSNGHITAAGLETQLGKFRDAITTALQNGGGGGGVGGGDAGAASGGNLLLLNGHGGGGGGGGGGDGDSNGTGIVGVSKLHMWAAEDGDQQSWHRLRQHPQWLSL
eukprot:SAG22_NODE_179_length_16124_cov_7.355445_5_plen_132_part_00